MRCLAGIDRSYDGRMIFYLRTALGRKRLLRPSNILQRINSLVCDSAIGRQLNTFWLPNM